MLFPKRASKVFINDRFYKVFSLSVSEAPKRCVANGFVMFCKVVKRAQFIVRTLCFFNTFEVLFPKRAPKVSLNDRLCKVFCSTFMQAPKRCVANGFLMFCKVVKCNQLPVEILVPF